MDRTPGLSPTRSISSSGSFSTSSTPTPSSRTFYPSLTISSYALDSLNNIGPFPTEELKELRGTPTPSPSASRSSSPIPPDAPRALRNPKFISPFFDTEPRKKRKFKPVHGRSWGWSLRKGGKRNYHLPKAWIFGACTCEWCCRQRGPKLSRKKLKDIRKREYKRDQRENKMLGFYPEVLGRMNRKAYTNTTTRSSNVAMPLPTFNPPQYDQAGSWDWFRSQVQNLGMYLNMQGIPVPLLPGSEMATNNYMGHMALPSFASNNQVYPYAGPSNYDPYYGNMRPFNGVQVQPKKTREQTRRSKEQAFERRKAISHAKYRVEERGRIRRVEMKRVEHELAHIQEIARDQPLTKEQQGDQTDAVQRALALSSAAFRERERAVAREHEQKRIRAEQRGQAKAFPIVQVVHSVQAIEPAATNAQPPRLLLDNRPYEEAPIPGLSLSRLVGQDNKPQAQVSEFQVTDVFGDVNQDDCVYMKVRIRRKMRMAMEDDLRKA